MNWFYLNDEMALTKTTLCIS